MSDWSRGCSEAETRNYAGVRLGAIGLSLFVHRSYRQGCSRVRIGELVGGPGFEPGASRSRTVRAAGLRQPPLAEIRILTAQGDSRTIASVTEAATRPRRGVFLVM